MQNILKSMWLKYQYEFKNRKKWLYFRKKTEIHVQRINHCHPYVLEANPPHPQNTYKREGTEYTHTEMWFIHKQKMEGKAVKDQTCVIFQSVSWIGTTTTESACTNVLEELTAFLTSRRQCAPAAITPA